MAATFKPVVYLKLSCPFCLKVAAFLSETGLLGYFEVRAFWSDDAREAEIRAELAPHLETMSFPTVQVEPGVYISDSDTIIAHYARVHDLEPGGLPFLNYVLEGPFRRMREQFGQIKELTAQLTELQRDKQ